MTAAPGVLGALVAATSTKPSNGSPVLLILVVVAAGFYFLIYRPQQKRQRDARALGNAFEVGDEVVTAGGIVGRVLDITDDRVTLETSVGASFVVLRPYILRKIEQHPAPSDVVGDEADQGPEHGAGAAHDDAPHEETAVEGPPADEPTDGGGTPRPGGTDASDGPDAPGADGPPII
jgi:preprotein translocase subunit YajC